MPLESLDLHARGVAHVLRDRQLTVPSYQRPFAWTTDNVLDFWNDLKSSLDRGDEVYFLGAIVLAAADDGQRGRETVIDGQQRLATTSVLIAAFRDAFLARDDAERAQVVADRYLHFSNLRDGRREPRLRLSLQDGEFFESVVLNRTTTEPTTASHRRIAEAYRLLVDMVESDVAASADPEVRISDWVAFLDEGVQVIAVEVPTQSDAFLIFETLNDRGAPLTIADLLKTHLLSKAADRFGEVEAAWSDSVEALGDYEESPVFVDFLRHYWSSLKGATRERDLYREIRGSLGTSEEVAQFAGELPSEAELYAAIVDPTHRWWAQIDSRGAAYMQILVELGLTQNRPLLMAILHGFGEQQTLVALRALVNWSVRGIVVGGIGGGRTERAFASAAVAVRSGRVVDANSLYDNLRPIIPSDDEFRLAFETETVPRRRIAEYIIKALESHLTAAAEAPLVGSQIEASSFLHPVMPSHATPDGWPGFAPDDMSRWTSRLGNYVLLDRPRRPRAPSWAEFRDFISEQPYELSRAASQFESWRPDSIRSRQAAIAERAIQLWPRQPEG